MAIESGQPNANNSLEDQLDMKELKHLHSIASRPSIKRALDELIVKYEKKIKMQPKTIVISNEHDQVSAPLALPMVKIVNYAWDESDKFVKLYLTLPNIEDLPKERIKVSFGDQSVEVEVGDLMGKDYTLVIKGLTNFINQKDSQFKVKRDSLVIMMKKSKEGEGWTHLTKTEFDQKKKSTPKFDERSDPGESIMNMMKQMYDDGDSEMKRTIRKAWCESQNKKSSLEDF